MQSPGAVFKLKSRVVSVTILHSTRPRDREIWAILKGEASSVKVHHFGGSNQGKFINSLL